MYHVIQKVAKFLRKLQSCTCGITNMDFSKYCQTTQNAKILCSPTVGVCL